MNKPTRVVLATGNAHKVSELQQLLTTYGLLGIELIPITDLVPDFDPDESGSDFETNAFIKAHTAHVLTGLPALADDSGLEVELSGGEPGVRSARYSGDDATDGTNRELLRNNLLAIGSTQSPAAFRCVLCLTFDTFTVFGEGSCKGTISVDEAGEGGFGYDAMFTPLSATQTFAEMDHAAKNAQSHRSLAVQHLVTTLTHTSLPDAVQSTEVTLLCEACILGAKGAWSSLEQVLHRMTGSTQDVVRCYEALLQTYLFAGFPVALESLSVLYNVATTKFPDFAVSPTDYNVAQFRQQGTALFERVYSGVSDKVISALTNVSPDLADWMIVEGYGKTLSRSGLTTSERELCIVAVLAVLGHTKQLTSHVRGAYLTGASYDQLCDVTTLVRLHSSHERMATLDSLVHQYRPLDTTSV